MPRRVPGVGPAATPMATIASRTESARVTPPPATSWSYVWGISATMAPAKRPARSDPRNREAVHGTTATTPIASRAGRNCITVRVSRPGSDAAMAAAANPSGGYTNGIPSLYGIVCGNPPPARIASMAA